MADVWDPTDEGSWLDEPSRRGSIARRAAYRAAKEGRVSVEIPPYVVSAPEWAARWGESAPPVGTVLRWTPVEGAETHVALCVDDDEWRVTTPSIRGGALRFPEVARIIANNPCSVAVDWREIPTVEARPAGDDAVKDWASQFLAPQAPEAGSPDATQG